MSSRSLKRVSERAAPKSVMASFGRTTSAVVNRAVLCNDSNDYLLTPNSVYRIFIAISVGGVLQKIV